MKKKNQKLADVRKALSGKEVNADQSLVILGGVFPWIDVPKP